MQSPSVRVAWLDAARGIGIILVVFGHVERGLSAAGIAQGSGWSIVDLSIYTFHMPLFMLLAGVNVPASLSRGTERFLKGKVLTVAYPYVLWSLIQGSTLVLLSSLTNGKGEWAMLAKIGWQPISPFWFLYALMAFFLIAAAARARAAILIPLAVAGLVASAFMSGESIVHQLCYMLSFFVIGVLGSEAIKKFRLSPAIVWLAGSALVWLTVFQIVPNEGATPYLSPLAFPAALAGCVFIMAVAQALKGRAEAFFAQLGKWSMSIYLMHILAASGTRIAMMKSGIEAPVAVYVIACTAVGVGAPVLAHVVLERMGLLPIFGLGKRKPRAPAPAAESIAQPG